MARHRPNDSSRIPTAATHPSASVAAQESSAAKAATPRKPRAPRPKKSAAAELPIPIEISEEMRRGMIAEAAYLRAERRGFVGGPDREKEDWLVAEAEVDALLEAGHGSATQ